MRLEVCERLLALLLAGGMAFCASRLRLTYPQDADTGGRLPAFSLTDQGNRTVTDRSLSPYVWVGAFMFTRCMASCPRTMSKLAALNQTLADLPRVRLVAISVDPAHDTPQVLASHAAGFGADRRRWLFLSGPVAQLERALLDGCGTGASGQRPNSLLQLAHSELLMLVDRDAVVRGYYRADRAGLALLAAAVRLIH